MNTRTLALIALLAATPVAQGQTLNKGTLSGKIMSKSAFLATPGIAPLLTVPSTGFFVITELCTANAGTGTFEGDTIGIFSPLLGTGCRTVNPAFAVPPGENLFCKTTSGTDVVCMINGLLMNK